MWLLTNFVFFGSLKLFFFSKSHHFLYFFIRHLFHYSAHKCSLCQTMACTDRKSHKEKHLLLWDNKLQKNDRDAFPTFCFSNQQTFGNVKKGLLSISLLLTKASDESSRCLSPALFNKTFAQCLKETETFAKFQTKVPQVVIVDTQSEILTSLREILTRRPKLFCSLSKHVDGKNLFFWESFSEMVLPDR